MQSPRGLAGAGGRLVRTLLLVAVLVPVTVLFVQVRQAADEKQSFADSERHGVEYLSALWRLTLALADAQSNAVAGRTPAADAITRAVDETGGVDQRLGDELRTQERWAGLRAKIEALPDRNLTGAAAYDGYSEVTDLALALFGKVRENSQLIRDPDADTYFLQDAGAEELPEAVIAAGRLADLAVLAPGRPVAERTTTVAGLIVARSAVTDPAGDLTEDLRSAVDGTQSRTLSGNLLNRLDLFQRGMDNLAAVSAPTGGRLAPDPVPVNSARTEMHGGAADLGETIFTELDNLITDRVDGVRSQQRLTLAAFVVAVLFVLAAITTRYLPSRAPVRRQVVRPEREYAGAAR